MKKFFLALFVSLASATAFAGQEFVFPPFVQQDLNGIMVPVQPAQPPAQILPQKPLVKKVKWIMTPNVTFVEAPYYTKGLFGGVVVKKQIVLHTTWVWTPVEVWE